jgi:hypothetical protein
MQPSSALAKGHEGFTWNLLGENSTEHWSSGDCIISYFRRQDFLDSPVLGEKEKNASGFLEEWFSVLLTCFKLPLGSVSPWSLPGDGQVFHKPPCFESLTTLLYFGSCLQLWWVKKPYKEPLTCTIPPRSHCILRGFHYCQARGGRKNDGFLEKVMACTSGGWRQEAAITLQSQWVGAQLMLTSPSPVAPSLL